MPQATGDLLDVFSPSSQTDGTLAGKHKTTKQGNVANAATKLQTEPVAIWPIWLARLLGVVALLIAGAATVVNWTPYPYWTNENWMTMRKLVESESTRSLAEWLLLKGTAFGPGMLASLAMLSFLLAAGACWCALKTSHARMRNVWVVSLVAVLVAVGLAWLARADVYSAYICLGWLVASGLGVCLYFSGSDGAVRRIAIALMVILLALWVGDALKYRLIEHPMTIREFQIQEKEFLNAQGWQKDSQDYLKYRQRLDDPAAIGPVGFSNVFGSWLAAASMIGLLLACERWKRKRPFESLPMLALGGAGILALYLTLSKGAWAAFIYVGVVLLIGFVYKHHRWRKGRTTLDGGNNRRWIVLAALLLLMLLPSLVVIGRGMMGPPVEVGDERSLMYRFWYWQTGAELLWLGHWSIGPGYFQDLFKDAKPAALPEAVQSLHNWIGDWFILAGPAGLGLIALTIAAWWQGLVHCLRTCGVNYALGHDEVIPPMQKPEIKVWPVRLAVYAALATGMILLVVMFYIHYPALMLPALLPFVLISAVIGIALAALILYRGVESSIMNLCLLVGAGVYLLHGQIEMTLYQPGSVIWVGAWLGLTAAARREQCIPVSGQTAASKRARIIVPSLLIASAIVIGIAAARPVIEQQSLLRDAAVSHLQGKDPTELLEQATDPTLPRHERAEKWLMGFQQVEHKARQ